MTTCRGTKNIQIRMMVSITSLVVMTGSFMLHHGLISESFSQGSFFQFEFDDLNTMPWGTNTTSRERSCKGNLTLMEDINIVTDSRTIPRTIHIIVNDKCVHESTKETLYKWGDVDDYSLRFYDNDDADRILSKPRPVLPHIATSLPCLISGRLKTFLVKLLLLWDYGGIIVDAGNISPSNIFLEEEFIREDDEAVFFMDGSRDYYYTHFMAAEDKHPIVHMMIQKTLADFFIQVTNQSFVKHTDEERSSDHLQFLMKYSFPSDATTNTTLTKPGILRREGEVEKTVTLVNTTEIEENYLINATIPVPQEVTTLKASHTNEACVNWDQFEDETDMISLEQLTNHTDRDVDAPHASCPDDLIEIHDTISPLTENDACRIRKIPKMIHMTSKTRCMTKEFAENVNLWRFENYSFLLHDDDAVQRLFDRDWPEFPLLHDAIRCTTSGAGKADLWRYLVLWAYGGIYTDIDNAPGPYFLNGTIISDDMNGFLEVEAARFPSQYFMAVSPHHSLSYMAVQVAIQRLFNEQNIVQQYVPYVTGPGALKWAMHFTAGDAYLKEGTHPTFDGKTVTLVGNRTAAMQRRFINRGSVKNRDNYDLMNMTHYNYAGRQKGLPRRPCVEVLYNSRKDLDY